MKWYRFARLLLTITLLLCAFGCASNNNRLPDRDEHARRLLKEIPPALVRELAEPQPPTVSRPSFSVYTWQPQRHLSGVPQLVLYGKRFVEPATLRVGDKEFVLSISQDGKKAVTKYPQKYLQKGEQILEGALITVTFGDEQYILPERFSSLKQHGLPQIRNIRFIRERVKAPSRIAGVGGQEVEAIRFECDVDGFVLSNAPITAFIGDVAIPNTEISGTTQHLIGYVYRAQDLEAGAPVMIDFGHGLKVMAPKSFSWP